MLTIIEHLHEIINVTPSTPYEINFRSTFGHLTNSAELLLNDFKNNKNQESLHQAWQFYITLYRQVKVIVLNLMSIPLAEGSPKLSSITKFSLSVPGTYHQNSNLITIQSFQPLLKVLPSKQRPRRMGIIGSDGNSYTFLLKAREDTRLDERVMQLFNFLTSLVNNSTIPMKNKLTINTYNVIPLTHEVGLIGWLEGCSTIFDVILEYRKKNSISVKREYEYVTKKYPTYNQLPLLGKQKAFRECLNETKGDDLKQFLFKFSTDSSNWISRRTAYATSLSMTSISGYILGLGDRHMCNIMIQNRTGKLAHIDFGDCFEVAQMREKEPEKVPFRLTRILVNALEASKIDGIFRSCCENILTLVRSYGEEILGLLEVFLYDPLLQWIQNSSNDQDETVSKIMKRIESKLKGTDFGPTVIDPVTQVNKLITTASSGANLCQMFEGWHPFW